MISFDAEKQQPGNDDIEFAVRWINTPDGFLAPGEDDLSVDLPAESSLPN